VSWPRLAALVAAVEKHSKMEEWRRGNTKYREAESRKQSKIEKRR